MTKRTSKPTETSNAKRGERVTFPGGVEGTFVGARRGVAWIAYAGQDFAAMCAAFDGR